MGSRERAERRERRCVDVGSLAVSENALYLPLRTELVARGALVRGRRSVELRAGRKCWRRVEGRRQQLSHGVCDCTLILKRNVVRRQLRRPSESALRFRDTQVIAETRPARSNEIG